MVISNGNLACLYEVREADNCLNNHNEYPILPLIEGGQIKKKWALKKQEIFSKIYKRYPIEKYKWLLNIAQGDSEYPHEAPKDYFINHIPNNEKVNFSAFKEIASQLGIDVNGLSGGVCLEDFNNDGMIDIFATHMECLIT